MFLKLRGGFRTRCRHVAQLGAVLDENLSYTPAPTALLERRLPFASNGT